MFRMVRSGNIGNDRRLAGYCKIRLIQLTSWLRDALFKELHNYCGLVIIDNLIIKSFQCAYKLGKHTKRSHGKHFLFVIFYYYKYIFIPIISPDASLFSGDPLQLFMSD